MGIWRGGNQCAVMLCFDFDAESLWLARDPDNENRPGTMSHGRYGATVGVPEILKLLDGFGHPATFFIPAWVAQQHPEPTARIIGAGHEVGHHGYRHEWVDPSRPQEEEEVFTLSLQILQDEVGITPRGYRSPAWEVSQNTLRLLVKNGFQYSSNMMDDLWPYRVTVDGRETDLVELPVQWTLDDAPFFLFNPRHFPRPIMSNEHVLSVWKQEFEGIYERGGLFNLTMHPQVTGRPSRIAMLRQLLEFIGGFDGVWYARGSEVAAYWLEDGHRPDSY